MYNISLITGDGIGPELSESAISILEIIHDKLNVKTQITSLEAGDSTLQNLGQALPDETLQSIKSSNACFAILLDAFSVMILNATAESPMINSWPV